MNGSEFYYCPSNEVIIEVRNNFYISPCLYDTVYPAAFFGFLCLFGIYMLIKCRNSTEDHDKAIKDLHYNDNSDAFLLEHSSSPNAKMFLTNINVQTHSDLDIRTYLYNKKVVPFTYTLQLTSFYVLFFMDIIELFLSLYYDKLHIPGYLLFKHISLCFCWFMAIKFIKTDAKIVNNNHGNNDRRRFHNSILTCIIAFAAVSESVKMIFWFDDRWVFVNEHHKGTKQLAEFSIYFIKLILTFAGFIFTLYSPGLLKTETLSKVWKKTKKSSVANSWYRSQVLWTFLTPHTPKLCFYVVLCFLLMLVGRVINVLVPNQYRKIINLMTDLTDKKFIRSDYVSCIEYTVVYVVLVLLQGRSAGTSGLIGNLRSYLWIPIHQEIYKKIYVNIFGHIFDLSLKWHLNRKTGEVIRIVDRSANSIDQVLNYVMFFIIPPFVDFFVAMIFFASVFNLWFSLMIFATMALYFISTVLITIWRTKLRKHMNDKDQITRAAVADTLINFETVKVFCNEKYEKECLERNIINYQKTEWISLASLYLLNIVQCAVINIGLIGCCLYCIHLVYYDTLTVGDFVMLVAYLQQLYVPLSVLGTYYRFIQSSIVDMESMFELFFEKPDFVDNDSLPKLGLTKGRIEFDNVCFSYSSGNVLKNVSFVADPGSVVAIVGYSGAGKSTLLKLLFRFYEPSSGTILIDGTDISKVSFGSLRKNIGIVPQDTVLFNKSIGENILYGDVNASEDKILFASRASHLKDRIDLMEDGFGTVVGERGLKLSGGEKQRVGIARCILKNSKILILDEATSSLDSRTERIIQNNLNEICKGRTTLIIAHRLSTVSHADKIIVLKEGVIAESGDHKSLLLLNGYYKELWDIQLKNQRTR